MPNVKYNQEIAGKIIEAITDGASQRAAAQKVGITPETLSTWKTKYPDFGEAAERAHGAAKVSVEQALHRKAMSGDVKAQWLWLKNRNPSCWTDKPQPDDEERQPTTFAELVAGYHKSKEKSKEYSAESNGPVEPETTPAESAPPVQGDETNGLKPSPSAEP